MAMPQNIGAPSSIRDELEASLKRLGVERIDLYQMHWPAKDGTPIEEYWRTLLDLKAEGKVRAVGLSNHNVAQLAAAEKIGHVDTLQPPFSAIRREFAAAELPWCLAHDTGVIVYSPMQAGLLTGAFTAARAKSLPADDWRSRNAEFTGDQAEAQSRARRDDESRRQAPRHQRRFRCHRLDARLARRQRRHRRRARSLRRWMAGSTRRPCTCARPISTRSPRRSSAPGLAPARRCPSRWRAEAPVLGLNAGVRTIRDARMYAVKEIFYTLQGEGANAGRAAVFCRFAGCNLWSGREQDRATADCQFCDTDFVGTDGEGGGKFATADDLAERLRRRGGRCRRHVRRADGRRADAAGRRRPDRGAARARLYHRHRDQRHAAPCHAPSTGSASAPRPAPISSSVRAMN